ncbi:efflux RND transporter periplasmic adaptor subunit [Alienimonas chondri]|uniref:Multidrug resistance protein MexA n=1 Tax=Alienimonas chondri TaxID=2681879 RepID=A0ABX1V717_9PLAN|nr:efflux RND transporter periplasmic adaptor subunit [Alienimonas chondri]NNJ24057.1 Multidrug resistance protein MexA [Alienimonas chondri]
MSSPRYATRRPGSRRGFAHPPLSAAVLLTGLLLSGCEDEVAPPPPPPPEVFVANPLIREVVEWDDYTARLRAVATVEIRPRVGGFLEDIHFADGEEVEAGALLFTIDPRPFEAALASAKGRLSGATAALQEAEALKASALAANTQAEAALELRDTQLARMRKLVERGAETQEGYDIEASQRKQAAADVVAARAQIKNAEAAAATAEAGIATAEAAVSAAELDLSFTRVTSPIAGRLSRRLVDKGNLVTGADGGDATLLTTVVSQDPMHAFVSAPERAFLKYSRQAASGERPSSRNVQNPAVLQLADETGYPHVGAIDFVDNSLDMGTDTMTGRLSFSNADGILTPGMFAKVKILGSGIYEGMLLPDSAVTIRQNAPSVLVVVPLSQTTDESQAGESNGGDAAPAGETVEPRLVTLGPLLGGLRVVRAGIEPTDRVVIRGIQMARPGVPVRTKPGEIELDEESFEQDARLELARAVRVERNANGNYDAMPDADGDGAETVAGEPNSLPTGAAE